MPGEYHRRQNYRYRHKYALAYFSDGVDSLPHLVQQFVAGLIDEQSISAHTAPAVRLLTHQTSQRGHVIPLTRFLLCHYLSTNAVFIHHGCCCLHWRPGGCWVHHPVRVEHCCVAALIMFRMDSGIFFEVPLYVLTEYMPLPEELALPGQQIHSETFGTVHPCFIRQHRRYFIGGFSRFSVHKRVSEQPQLYRAGRHSHAYRWHHRP